jgi:prepilin-type N-terminal cleavage/methylation domain-containing protein
MSRFSFLNTDFIYNVQQIISQPATRRTTASLPGVAAGFTIVELLIVIVVIGILAAIVVVAYNGIQEQARSASRDSDVAQYYKAIEAARINSGQLLRDVTGSVYSMGSCNNTSSNPSGTEPKDLPKSHACWVRYYSNLSTIGAAAGMNLDSLRTGDARGNPYMLDENEGENCNPDRLYTYNGSGITYTMAKEIPRLNSAC